MLRQKGIRLSMLTHTSWTRYMKMTLFELNEFIGDLQEVNQEA